MNGFETKKRLILEDKSEVFKNWAEHSNITKDDFISSLEWVCDDPLDEMGRMTREVGLTPEGIIKLNRTYTTTNIDAYGQPVDWLVAFYRQDTKELWGGEMFTRKPTNEHEKMFVNDDGLIEEMHKISLNCKDRI